MDNGQTIVIESMDAPQGSRYIQRLTMNGKPRTNAWLCHANIWNGAVLTLKVSLSRLGWAELAGHQLVSNQPTL
jgi:putative alpha-1,2-mannosidase